MSLLRVVTAGLAVFVLAAGKEAETVAPPAVQTHVATDFAPLDSLVLEEVATTGTPGASIAIIAGDSVAYALAYGVASIETREPATSYTLFRIASMTQM